ncbi:MAG: hybrid sensor histidine kinase/response regulator [Planctomycetes bacterium]|nr:hybrid sensor histidine kinase/response regulator [Planctomycetota bacterium]
MTKTTHEHNSRILIVDDTPAIHGDYKKILLRDESASAGLEDALCAFLDGGDAAAKSEAPPAGTTVYYIDSAYQGEEALLKVRSALASEKPYAMAFVDVRMPPGWDGVKTIEEIWKVDASIQIAICTAFSDYSWDKTVARLGRSDRLLILKKPFDSDEICQIASALTEKWNIAMREKAVLAQLRLAEEEARAYAVSLETVNKSLVIAKAASDKITELKTHFYSKLGDEVNRNISSIVHETDALRKQAGASAELPLIDRIVSTSEQLVSTFHRTLDLSMLEASRFRCEPAPCDPAAAVAEVVEEWRTSAEAKSLKLTFVIGGEMPGLIHVDSDRVKQIVRELIRNAVQFTSAGGVEVLLKSTQTERWDLAQLQCDITDSGPGIPELLQSSVFEPFGAPGARSCRTRGAGLGLAVAKKMALVMGGDLTFETIPGRGTTFTFTVDAPIAQTAGPAA